MAGEFKNHMQDEHATKAAETATALEEHTKDGHAKTIAKTVTALSDHIDNNDRHTGEAPGPGRSTAKTVGLASAGIGGTGVVLFLLNMIKDYLSS